MSALLFALVAAFALSIGARDQLLIADLRARLGPSPGLIATGVAVSAATGALAGWAGGRFAALLSVNTAQMFVAMALLLAAVELAWPNRGKPPAEPTRSLFAIGLALALRQLTDAARFVVFAIGAALAFPHMAALGGAMGGHGGDCDRLCAWRKASLATPSRGSTGFGGDYLHCCHNNRIFRSPCLIRIVYSDLCNSQRP